MLLLAVLVGALIEGIVALADEPASAYRLSRNAVPNHYNIQLRTEAHSGNGSYEGSEDIYVDIVKATNEIVLHSINVTVKSVRIYSTLKHIIQTELTNPVWRRDSKNQQLSVMTSNRLANGSYLLKVEFFGTATKEVEGIFIESYQLEDGKQEHYLATHFEPISARTAFPCFDEPSLKATFNLSIIHHKNHSARSNMPLHGPAEPYPHDEEYVVSTFYQTPKMSTYQLVFIVSNLVERTVGNISVCTRTDVLKSSYFALQTTEDILNALNKYTGLPYNSYIPKLMLAAFPNIRVNWDASENWGLITFQEESLLFDPQRTGNRRRFDNMAVIAHELAHQWFGNLVTPEWWTHLWLKEGFATLYHFYALDLAYPNERFMDLFNMRALQMASTGSCETQLIAKHRRTPNDINNYGYAIYYKAGSMLNMFRLIVGDDKWRLIMRSFLRKHQFDSVTPKDLYQEVETVVGEDSAFPKNIKVAEVFESWISHEGIPVLNVRRLYSSGGIVNISQYRMQPCTEIIQSLIIPYSYAVESVPFDDNIGPVMWLTQQAELISTDASDDEWIVFNKQQFGAYRVNYDERNWKLIIQALRSNVSCIHRFNRAQLLDDAYNLVLTGMLDIGVLLELMTFLRNETDVAVWNAARTAGNFMADMIWSSKYYGYFKIFMKGLIESLYNSFTTQHNHPTTASNLFLQRRFITTACWLRNEHCLNRAKVALQEAVGTNTSVHPDERKMVYCYGQRNTSDAEFDWIWNQYKASKHVQDQTDLIELLACTDRVDHLRKLIKDVFESTSDDEERRQLSFVSLEIALQQERRLGMWIELLCNDAALINLLGAKYTEKLLFIMRYLAVTENQKNELTDLTVSIEDIFDEIKSEDMREYFTEKLAETQDANTLAMGCFFEQYVKNIYDEQITP